ncbi:MAG: aminotransferase class I/II-fold pyridoxal phosphate-dependent enzyme [Desulfitobacterium sp.]|nr:aminotransferase class I/II-fold pyridoxal phosphate-dependent enzyme [Desulfitobacterium sp.]
MKAERLKSLGASVFTELDDLRRELEKSGKKLLNLSIGSPDGEPGEEIRRVLAEAALDGKNYGYTLSRGTAAFREECARWYYQRFGVSLDPETEVLPLMGSQDGLAHIFMALCNPGDKALIPDPGYPIYTAGLLLAGGEKIPMALREENGFLPVLEEIPPQDAAQAKFMFLNYPNNPTAAVAPLEFFQDVVSFAQKNNILVFHDAAYSELAFDGYRPVSFLEAKGAKDVGVEFHSLSKTYNLAGIRLGFVVGNKEVISALSELKSNIDYGTFGPALIAGAYALKGSQEVVEKNRQTYQERRDIWVQGCAEVGWDMPSPRGSMFIWAPVPTQQDSRSFAYELAREAGIILVPGVAFGEYGEGYVRIGLVQEQDKLKEGVARIQEFLRHKG